MLNVIFLLPILLYAAGLWFPNLVDTPVLAISGTEIGIFGMLLFLPFALLTRAGAVNRPHTFGFVLASLASIALFAGAITLSLSQLATASGAFREVFRIISRDVFGLILVAYTCLVVPSLREVRIVWWTAALGFIVMAVLIAPAFFDPSLNVRAEFIGTQGRIQGFFNHPNQLGIVTATILPLFLLAPLGRQRLPVYAVLCVAALFCVLASGSKTNIVIATLLVVLCLGVRYLQHGEHVRVAVLAITAPVVLLTLLSGGLILLETYRPYYAAEVLRLLRDPLEAETLLGRAELWSGALVGFGDSPLLGVGLMTNTYLVVAGHAHNLTLDVLLKYGLVGFAGYGCWLAAAIATAVASVRRSARAGDLVLKGVTAGYLIAMITYLLVNHFSDSGQAETIRVFYFVWALALATLRVADIAATKPAATGTAPAVFIGRRWMGSGVEDTRTGSAPSAVGPASRTANSVHRRSRSNQLRLRRKCTSPRESCSFGTFGRETSECAAALEGGRYPVSSLREG